MSSEINQLSVISVKQPDVLSTYSYLIYPMFYQSVRSPWSVVSLYPQQTSANHSFVITQTASIHSLYDTPSESHEIYELSIFTWISLTIGYSRVWGLLICFFRFSRLTDHELGYICVTMRFWSMAYINLGENPSPSID